jgi:ferredoxin
MPITKVWMTEGCTACGLCESICPDVFEMQDIAVVKEGADYSAFEAEIKDAAASCPVEIILFEEE